MRVFASLAAAVAATFSLSAVATVDNFVLLDQHGKAQELFYHKDAPAIVLMGYDAQCAALASSAAELAVLQQDFADDGVQVMLVDVAGADRATLASSAKTQGMDLPLLQDSAGVIAPSLGLDAGGEVIVIDAKARAVVFRGGISADSAASIDAGDAVAALLSGVDITGDITAPVDCPTVAQAPVDVPDYTDTIAPMLVDNCVACHREGGIGPWAMSEYRMIQGFAPMIREVVRTKRMPPWHADPEIGHWQGDAGLSDEETAQLLAWIEAGAPRGKGVDPLKAVEPLSAEWPLGEPDLIIEVQPYDIPATGVVDYKFPVVQNPLDRDAWVRAATIIPGDSKVVHHVLMGSADEPPAYSDRESVFQNYIMGYAPGNESAFMPSGTGVFVPKGGVYLFQMHYTPYGKATTDVTKVGLYFADEPPANYLRQQVVVNPRIKIPAGAPAHEESAYFTFWEDATVYSLVPHSHYRGRSSTFELVYPDGRTEVVLSVPNYDFNWQRTYEFEQPIDVPAGTQIIHRTVYDNSANNAANPAPEEEVRWGLQSAEEMLYGSVSYSWKRESSDAPIHSNLTADTAQLIGFMDSNMDGEVTKAEMPARLRDSIGWRWWLLDADKNGTLNLAEMEALVKRLSEQTGP